mgnify:CR=1 FL=1
MTTYLLPVGSGQRDLEINGNGIPTINAGSAISRTAANWQFDTVRVQPRTRDEKNDTCRAGLHLG